MRWEVPTMRSATSFFDKTTARSDLRRHWPIAFIYTCVWLVGLPVNLWSSSMWMPEEMTPALRAAQIIIGSYPTLAGALFVFGCVLAMALMGYLMSPRAVGLLHALPVRRGTLLATHTLVGWLMLNVPALLAVLVSIPVQAYYGGVAWGALGAWLLVHCGLSLFFLALGLLCAMVTGWLLAIPAIYAVVNFAVIAAAGLVRTLCSLFCYGYAGDDDFAPFVYWLTPVVNLVKRFGTCGVERSDAAPYPWQVQFPADVVHAVGIYTAAGAALLWKGAVMEEALGGMADGGLLPVLLAAAVCMLISMNDMTAPSVSLEGKSLWLAQSLPVTPWQVLRAKMVMQLLLTGIPAAVCLLCAVLAISMTAAEAVLLAAVCLLFVVLSAMLGLFLGLKMPNLTWTSEITPIKQSACVGIALLGGWAYALLLGGGYLLAGWHLGAALYMGCFAAATLAACAVLYLWLKKRGGAVLAAL